jgi:hypothetical protein
MGTHSGLRVVLRETRPVFGREKPHHRFFPSQNNFVPSQNHPELLQNNLGLPQNDLEL